MLVYTDCANEADDQYALAHIFMTQKFDVRGIIAAHFDANSKGEWSPYKQGTTAQASLEEINRVLDYMGLAGKYPVALGAGEPLADEATPQISEGAQMIIDEAMHEDDRPLYIGCQGSITDLASAILMRPEICERMTTIWIGGGDYPAGGFEFNLMQESERVDNFHMILAPRIDVETMNYIPCDTNREIRVYDYIDYRITLEDFFAKLAINYRE